jgi:hypothetical protein
MARQPRAWTSSTAGVLVTVSPHPGIFWASEAAEGGPLSDARLGGGGCRRPGPRGPGGETAGELRTLTATGASGWTRRTISAALLAGREPAALTRQQTDLVRVLELVLAAHRGAKEAITELRDLARGIHPPVLDQGLGIALTSLAARSDVPVELVVDLPERPSAAIETIAYFCAAELLANVAKHSGARHATLEVAHEPGLLRLRVCDDGCSAPAAAPTGSARSRPGNAMCLR